MLEVAARTRVASHPQVATYQNTPALYFQPTYTVLHEFYYPIMLRYPIQLIRNTLQLRHYIKHLT